MSLNLPDALHSFHRRFHKNEPFTLKNLIGSPDREKISGDVERLHRIISEKVGPLFKKNNDCGPYDQSELSCFFTVGLELLFSTYADFQLKLKIDEQSGEKITQPRKENLAIFEGHLNNLCEEINRPSPKNRILLGIYNLLSMISTLFPQEWKNHIEEKITTIRNENDAAKMQQINRIIKFCHDTYYDDRISLMKSIDLATSPGGDVRALDSWRSAISGFFKTTTAALGIKDGNEENDRLWTEAFPDCEVSLQDVQKLIADWHEKSEDLHANSEDYMAMMKNDPDTAVYYGQRSHIDTKSDIETPQTPAEGSSLSIEENLMVKNGLVLPGVPITEAPAVSDDTIILDGNDRQNSQRSMPDGAASDNDIALDHPSSGRPRSNTV